MSRHTPTLRALVAGHVTLDRYPSQRPPAQAGPKTPALSRVPSCCDPGPGVELLPGGGAFYGARTLAALGERVRLATALGRDFPAANSREPARADGRPDIPADVFEGIAVAARRCRSTTMFENSYLPGGARTQRLLGRADDVPPPDGSCEPLDVLFLAPVIGELDPAAWVEAVSARVIGLSVQGLVREADAATGPDGARVNTRRYQPEPDELYKVSAAFLSEQDIAGQEELMDRLRRAVPIVALTRGERGASVYVKEHVLEIGVFRTKEVDPTGAGDVFAAAFLHALARGEDLAACGRLAAAAASIVIEGRGGTELHRLGEAHLRAKHISVSLKK